MSGNASGCPTDPLAANVLCRLNGKVVREIVETQAAYAADSIRNKSPCAGFCVLKTISFGVSDAARATSDDCTQEIHAPSTGETFGKNIGNQITMFYYRLFFGKIPDSKTRLFGRSSGTAFVPDCNPCVPFQNVAELRNA